jgi:hypothetical protein
MQYGCRCNMDSFLLNKKGLEEMSILPKIFCNMHIARRNMHISIESIASNISTQMRNLALLEMAVPFPVLAPITSTVLFWIPLQEIFHLVRCPNRQSAITGTGRDSFCTISGTGLCHFRYDHSLGPVPKLGSMRVVPFPGWGSASSGTVIHWAPYQNWTLCAWSRFRYGALPVLVRSFNGFRTKTGLYAQWVRPLVGVWFDGDDR